MPSFLYTILSSKRMKTTAVKLSFFYLLIVAAAGTLLRSMPFLPNTGLDFQNVLHAHSHLAFLGWVYSLLFVAYVHYFLPPGSFGKRRYQVLFWLTQAAMASMFVAFVLKGYGPVSVSLLTTHTAFVVIFIVRFLKDAKLSYQLPSSWFALAAFVSFLVSGLGPLAIPFVKIFGDNDPHLVKMAIHFYLHFHYNGWFVFSIFAFLLKIMESQHIALPIPRLRQTFILLLAGIGPAYFLIIPFVKLPAAIDWLVTLAIVAQWVGFALFFAYFFKNKLYKNLKTGFSGDWLLPVAFIFLFSKYSLELFSQFPGVSSWVDLENRFLTIGYLHLIFLGAVTPFLWWLVARSGWADWRKGASKWGFTSFFTGFIFHEAYLFLAGLGLILPQTTEVLALCALALLLGIAALLPIVFQPVKSSTLNKLPEQKAFAVPEGVEV